jgi:hypothetical protein
MTPDTDEDLDRFIEAGLALLRLPVQQGWKPAIREHLKMVLSQAARVETFPLPDDVEPAPTYEP